MDLARDRLVAEERIVRQLNKSVLTNEQRLRLLRAVETRLLLLPRGALGIHMNRAIADFTDQAGQQVRGVEVLELLPGMPAEEHLRVGDILISIEDEPFESSEDVSRLIKQYWPGEEVELEVSRDEPVDAAGTPRRTRRLRFRVKLGSTDQLNRQSTNRWAVQERRPLEDRVRRYYEQHSPQARPLRAPEKETAPPQVGDLPMGLDPAIILQQVINDRAATEAGLSGSLTREELQAKWQDYARDISTLLETGDFDAEGRRVLEQLRTEVLELADIAD